MSTLGFPEGPGEQVSQDGRWRWDGQRWTRLPEPGAPHPPPRAVPDAQVPPPRALPDAPLPPPRALPDARALPDSLPPRRPAPAWEPSVRDRGEPPRETPVEPLDASAFTGDRMLRSRAIAPTRG